MNINTQKPSPRGKVVIASNLIRKREVLDKDGNIIDLKTKQVIKPADKEEKQ